MPRFAFFAVVTASVSLACAGSGAAVGSNSPAASKVVVTGHDFDLTPGQTAMLDGGALSVSFDKVAEDSRCPTGVQCIWAGNGAVAMTVNTPGTAKYAATLNTTLTPKAVTAGPYDVTLVALNPYPKYGSKITPATYVATLHIIHQ